MIKTFIKIICLLLLLLNARAQDVPNFASGSLSPNSIAASKMSNTQVNYFTGLPRIGVPIYSYKNITSGLSLDISLNYFAGGVRVAEPSSSVGLSWSLNGGGIITRQVRGMPDDIPNTGYIYAPQIPTDFRADANKYYNDSLDTQPDVFNFSCPGGGGKFFIGKNAQIIVVPNSKIKVIPTFQEASLFWQTLKSFRIITEDGIKYDFNTAEYSTINLGQSSGYAPMVCGYFGKTYASAWHLTQIISAFNTDTIKLNYVARSSSSGFSFPQILYRNNSNNFKPAVPPGTANYNLQKLESIYFPDNTHVNFVYSNDVKYSDDDYVLTKVKISDTTFRYGYLLGYQSSYEVPDPTKPGTNKEYLTRLLLKTVTPFTAKQKQDGYQFNYANPLFLPLQQDTIQNKRDHWGFYNGAVNGNNLIPSAGSYTAGANRTPNSLNVMANMLVSVRMPSGGLVQYSYELNDRYPYSRDSLQVQINPSSTTLNNIVLNQVFNTRHQIGFFLDQSVSRAGVTPIVGSGGLNCYIKSTDGLITYTSTTISLYEIFYQGLKKWTFNLPNGTYRLETQLSSGTTINSSFPINVNWENKSVNNILNAVTSGGLRISSIIQSNIDDLPFSAQSFRYVFEDGKSSGFLGEIPRYDYPFRENILFNGTTNIDYTAISSEPVGFMDYAQGSIVGYSRVEVINKGMYMNKNLGKTVFEFTDLKDLNADAHTATFPFAPIDTRGWGLGLPKRISIYDSSGILVKRSVNTYAFDTIVYNISNFKSIKMGHSGTLYNGDRNNTSTPKTKIFIGEEYYPTGGRSFLISTKDSLFQTNGTVNAQEKIFEYDGNFNIKKVVSNYDKSRGLQLEQRFYYPYDYSLGGSIGLLRDSNILTVPVSTESWIIGDANPRMLSGMITSYKQISNSSIKPDSIFLIESNKPLSQSAIGIFNPSTLNRNYNWFKPQTQFVSYDSKGNVLETKIISSGISSSTILDYKNQYTIAKVSNAVSTDIGYTSFEADGNGNWNIQSSLRTVNNSITGNRSYNLSNGNITKTGLLAEKQYLLTVWAQIGTSITVNGSLLSSIIASQNNWNLYQIALSNITSITIIGSGLIDELRLYPKDANMETYTYEPMVGLTSKVDLNNFIIYNEYDELNRIKLIRDKDKNIVKRFDYSDTSMPINLLSQWQYYGSECSPNSADISLIYKDINPFSDSAGMTKKVYQGLDCTCTGAVNNPKYKVVYGKCEMGNWAVVSSTQVKINYQWVWRCTYRYCFSDGSQSDYYEQVINPNSCPLTCFIAI